MRSKEKERHPKKIKVVPLFYKCLETLKQFFSTELAPITSDRSTTCSLVGYGFADASKGGLGSMIDKGDGISYRIGVWGTDSQEQSSNWRELCNLVESLEEEASDGSLNNSTLIIATDNTTAETCFYKGNSSSVKLYNLVVRVRLLQIKCGINLYITHVSGKRMQAQGTDGISRGQLREGVSAGDFMLSYCPWNMDALQASPKLLKWIQSWTSDLEVLEPCDWFIRGHNIDGGYYDGMGFWRNHIRSGTYLWKPPPAVAHVALEQLRISRLKRQQSRHIFVVPTLFCHLWRKQLGKACDVVLSITPDFDFWPEGNFETLTIGICFPFLSFCPWQLHRTPKMFAVARQVRQMCKNHKLDPRNLLRKLLVEVERFPTMQKSMVWKMLYFRSTVEVPH